MRPFPETVTQVEVTTLSLILLTIGVMRFVGMLLIGVFLHRDFYHMLIAIPLRMAMIAALLMMFGHSVWIVAPLPGFWGLIATAAPTGWWTWIARTLPDAAEAGGGLMVAVVPLSIVNIRRLSSAILWAWGIHAAGHGFAADHASSLDQQREFMNFYPFNDIETISPRAVLFITGGQAHSKEFSEDNVK